MSNRSDRTQSDSGYRGENYGRSRGSYNRDRYSRGPADGNIAKLEVKSASIVVIDQFMLGTAQFLKRIGYFLSGESTPVDERSFIEGLEPAVRAFGGAVLSLEAGDYGIYRDPSAAVMAVAPEASFFDSDGEPTGDFDDDNIGNRADDDYSGRGVDRSGPGAAARRLLGEREGRNKIATVNIETRCLVFIDSQHLRDPELIHSYKSRREARDDKGGRDLLRQYGAAVRYGFNRKGDQLGVFELEQPNSYGLWTAR